MRITLYIRSNVHRPMLRSQFCCKVLRPRSHPPPQGRPRTSTLRSLRWGSRLLVVGIPKWPGNDIFLTSAPMTSNLILVPKFSSSSSSTSSLSPFDPKNLKIADNSTTDSDSELSNTPSKIKKRRRTFVPRIAAVQLTEKARLFFKRLLERPIRPDIVGIMLNFDQSKSGEPRMVYTFQFVTKNDIDPEQDEGVSLELIPSSQVDPTTGELILVPKPPIESRNDGLPKLYIHHHAFLKVLGATIDVDTETLAPILYDREGNRMDPNA